MRRPQSAFRFAAVTASLFVVTLVPTTAHAAPMPVEAEPPHAFDAPKKCTQHGSQYTAPTSIRVLRTKRTGVPKSVAGTVQTVNFKQYVKTVMAVEWPEHYPIETLKAGAVATKQFAWYYIIFPRGKKVTLPNGKRVCYDVVDTWVDQVYYPERNSPGPKIKRAVNESWETTVRKFNAKTDSSKFFLLGYRAGDTDKCGADRTGYKLFHRSTRACGKQGMKWREILRLYLKPRLEIVTTGRHDIIGKRHGDSSALVKNDAGNYVANVWTQGTTPPEPGSNAGITLSSTDFKGARSSDVNNDSHDDLVWMRKTGSNSAKIKVALSDGVNYGNDQTWYDGPAGVPMSGARLLVGDFNADGRRDVGILGKGSGASKGKFVVLKNKSDGSGFGAPVTWWSGVLDLDKVAGAWGLDVTGDGRADLVVRQNLPGGGIRMKVAVAKKPSPGMGSLSKRWESTSINASRTRMVGADANRDGQDDLLMVVGRSGKPTRIDRLQGLNRGGLKRVQLWTAPKSDPIQVSNTRISSADVNYDGRTDLVLFSKKGTGTRIRVLKTGYDRMSRGPDKTVGSMPFSRVRPY